MKMSTHTGCYTHTYKPDLCELIEYFSGLGYQALDLSLDVRNPGWTEYKLRCGDDWKMHASRVKAKLEAANMFFCQSHAPIANTGYTETEKKELRRCIEVCGFFGIRSLVVHLLHVPGSNREEFVRKNLETFSEFLPDLEKQNVNFCFENIGYWGEPGLHCFSADDLLCVIDAFHHGHIHACWDTGHGNLTRQPQYESILKLGKHLRAVHVQDNCYPITSPDGEHVPDMHLIPLMGNVNFDGFIQGLKDIGYEGAFSMESDIPNRRGHMDFIRNGETQLNLKPIPFRLREMADRLQAETGKFMLQTYGLWEG